MSVLLNGYSRFPDVKLYKSLLKITVSAFVNSAFVPEYYRMEREKRNRIILRHTFIFIHVQTELNAHYHPVVVRHPPNTTFYLPKLANFRDFPSPRKRPSSCLADRTDTWRYRCRCPAHTRILANWLNSTAKENGVVNSCSSWWFHNKCNSCCTRAGMCTFSPIIRSISETILTNQLTP